MAIFVKLEKGKNKKILKTGIIQNITE